MAGRGSVKLSIYSTFKDDGTKKAERALAQFAKKFGEVDKATGKLKLNSVSKQLAEQSIKWDRLAQKCQKFSTQLGKASKAFAPFSAAAAGALGGSIKLAADFETAMGKVATIMDKSEMSVKDMGDALLDLSTQTGKGATELAEAAYQAQSASVSTKNTVGFVEQAAKLSKAGFTETATAVDTLTTVLNAYKLSESETAAIADKLVQTQNRGKTTVDQLSQSIGQAIPTAAAYNVNLDNLLSSYVILTKQGINTANATTYLNGMMTELAKEGSKVSGVLKSETGKSFTELMGEGKSLGDVLGILYDSVDGDSTAFANLWGNVRAGRGALALAQAGTEGFNAELAGMAQSAGTVDDALEDLETPAVKAQKALNALKNTGIVLGQQILADIAPALQKMVEGAQRLYEKFRDMPKGTKQAIAKLLAFTAALAPLLKMASVAVGVFGKFASGMGKITASLAKFAARGGMAASVAGKLGTLLSGPVMAAIAGVAVIIGTAVKAFIDLKKRQDDLVKATTGLEKACSSLNPSLADEAKALASMGQASETASADVYGLIERQAQLAETIEERNRNARADIAMLEAARDTIAQYANSTGLAEEEQGKLQAAIALVNEQCGTQYTVTDAVNGVIKDEKGNILKTTGALDKYIAKKQEAIRLEAIQENLKDLYKAQYEAQEEVNKAVDEYNAQLEKANSIKGLGSEEAQKNLKRYEDKVKAAKSALDSCNKSIANTEKEMGKATKATQKAGNAMSSVASTAKTKGASMASNFAAGIAENASKATGAASSMASGAKKAATVSTYSLGYNFAIGMKNGIVGGAAKVASAAASMATSAISAAKKAAGISSPSKVMYQQGKWFGEGYEQGIEAETRNVASAARGMADTALGQFDQRPGYAGGAGGSVTNIYIDGAKVNDDPAIQSAFLGLMGELRRLAYV